MIFPIAPWLIFEGALFAENRSEFGIIRNVQWENEPSEGWSAGRGKWEKRKIRSVAVAWRLALHSWGGDIPVATKLEREIARGGQPNPRSVRESAYDAYWEIR